MEINTLIENYRLMAKRLIVKDLEQSFSDFSRADLYRMAERELQYLEEKYGIQYEVSNNS